MAVAACTSSTPQAQKEITVYNDEQRLPGDSSVYGLACEGCTDSLLVFLPFSGGNPDTLDILNARVNHRVFGRPDIGDEVAVILNDSNKTIAEMVINIERLKGQWCYMVYPRMRPRAGASSDTIVTLPKDFPDSLRKKWFQPREYGFELLSEHSARTIGLQRSSEIRQNGPMEYPQLRRYRQWYIYNGHILLCETRRDTVGNQQVIRTDTADIILLRRDSLRLRFSNHEQGYYRKTLP